MPNKLVGALSANLQEQISQLVQAAISAADPGVLLSEQLEINENGLVISGTPYAASAVILVSVGKAAVLMAQNAAEQLGPYLKEGLVISKLAEAPDLLPGLKYYQGSHPIPDQRSIVATKAVQVVLILY